MKQLTLSFIILLFSVASPVTAGDKLSPTSINGATTVDAVKAKALFDKGVIFVDVRKDKDWNAGRIPDAVHIELKKVLSEKTLSKEVKKDQEVVIYCNGEKCMRSSKASAKAVSWGFSKVYYFRGGLPAWKAAGYPVE
ncbi:MAG TPA: rhodanese-like domain-containing protein [Gammaproteobacteria bacterium]|nr:rhodanese-like domain-containing protein [Gammaproteobacteria bacterium]